MEAARADLRAANPGDTVATVGRSGFVHVPRLAAAYRNAFDENPSETLRADFQGFKCRTEKHG